MTLQKKTLIKKLSKKQDFYKQTKIKFNAFSVSSEMFIHQNEVNFSIQKFLEISLKISGNFRKILLLIGLMKFCLVLAENVEIYCGNSRYFSEDCTVGDIRLTEETEDVKFEGDQELRKSIVSFYIHSSTVDFVPEQLFQVFPKLQNLDVSHSDLGGIVDDYLLIEASPLKSLELKFNEIEEITEEAFKELILLESLSLSSNKLESLPENIFQNNTELKRIELDGNQLTRLPIDLFFHNINLQTINLRRNLIQELDENLFTECEELTNLLLSNNLLETLPSNIFMNNLKLNTVDLDENNIRKLDPQTFKELPNLAKLNLRENVCISQQYGFDVYIERAVRDLQACFNNQRYIFTTKRKYRRILKGD
jgi:Leucine-rich repeat (LRR) protein